MEREREKQRQREAQLERDALLHAQEQRKKHAREVAEAAAAAQILEAQAADQAAALRSPSLQQPNCSNMRANDAGDRVVRDMKVKRKKKGKKGDFTQPKLVWQQHFR
eukprot:6188786-Pleurochrysis_carterae.AAC.2